LSEIQHFLANPLPPPGPHDRIFAMMKHRPIVSRNRDMMGCTAVFRGAKVPVQSPQDHLKAGESPQRERPGHMTRDQVKEVIQRVLTWPRERQEDAVQMLLALEAQEGELYHPDDDEWAAIEEGVAQAKRREVVSVDEIAALFKPRGS
jgi:hypothetical protein